MRTVDCLKCGKHKPHEAHGFCRSCYESERQKLKGKRKTLTECIECKRQRPHHAKGLCGTCYNKTVYTPEQRNEIAKEHYKANKQKAIERVMTRRWYAQDKTACGVCGETNGLEFHHLADNNGKYDRNKFVVLCKQCHTNVTKKASLLNKACGLEA